MVFEAIHNEQIKYSWLISNYDCNQYPDDRIPVDGKYVWITGEELSEIVNNNKIQFIWGVFSAFPKHILIDNVLEHKLPYADGYAGFWKNPISIQHPLAEMEIVAWDSGLVLLISKNEEIIEDFMSYFPLTENLADYNNE